MTRFGDRRRGYTVNCATCFSEKARMVFLAGVGMGRGVVSGFVRIDSHSQKRIESTFAK